MGIVVDTTKALTTLDTLKSYLGITDTSKDELLGILINYTSNYAENYCERQFNKQTDVIKQFDGGGNEWLYPNILPIISVTSLYDDTTRVFGTGSLIDPSDYIIYDNAIMLDGFVFTKGTQNIKLKYTAGYILPNNASFNSPQDLEMAIILYCSYLYNTRSKQGLVSEKMGGIAFTYGRNPNETNVPEEVKYILNKYKRFVC